MPSVLKHIGRYIAKLRHSRGFGVHSPFAYRFITETLRQEHIYYAYHQMRTPQERLIFRVVLALRPATVALEGMPSARKAVRYAMPSARFTDAIHAEMIIADGHFSALEFHPANGNLPHLLLLGNAPGATRSQWREAMDCGMTFDNGRGSFVAVSRPDLPRQDFDISFI